MKFKIICQVAVSLALILPEFASAASIAASSIHPNGKYGKASSDLSTASSPSEWKPEWSDAYFKCAENNLDVQEMFRKISNGEVQDIGPGKKWCTNSDVFKPANTRLIGLAMFKLMAKPESNYDPAAMNPKSPNPPAVGVLQIGPSDVEAFKCTTPSGQKLYTGAPYVRGNEKDPRVALLKIPENNICCALIIAAAHAKGKKGKVLGDGKHGIMASFWESVRVQSSKGAHGDELASQLNGVCKNIGQGDSFMTAAEVELARNAPTGLSAPAQVAEIARTAH